MEIVIKSFANKETEKFWQTGKSKGMPPSNLRRAPLRKLVMVDDAADLKDLKVPPGNHLEVLHEDREGQHSIRINDQWRICFRWTKAGPEDVMITDYH